MKPAMLCSTMPVSSFVCVNIFLYSCDADSG